jgi:tetratricopeptide (TPR) repeat protein
MNMRLSFITLFASLSITFPSCLAANDSDREFAYEQLKSLQNENAGNPDYDLRFALVAMSVYKYDEAIFALERLIQYDPRNGRVRAELAKCYYETGQYHLARSLFDQIKESEGIAETVRNNINFYLHAMDKRGSEFDLQNQAYVEASAGYDSNINAGSDLSNISIPNLGNVSLTDDSLAKGDSHKQIGAGFSLSKATSRHKQWRLSGQIKSLANDELDRYDQQSIDVDGSYMIRDGDNRYRFAIQYQELELGDQRFFDSKGIAAQWLRILGENLQAGVSLSLTDVDFASDFIYRNHQRQLTNGEVIHTSGNWAQRLSIYLGREVASQNRYDYALRDAIRGISYRLSYQFNANLIPYFSGQYTYSDYGEVHPVFQQVRSDSFRAYELGLLWQPSNHWIINPSLTDARNQSDVEAYSYDRERAQVNLRYNF